MKNNSSSDYQYKADVDTSNAAEVKYWTNRWNISPQQLTGAIRATKSTSVIVIDEYLFNRKNRPRRPRFINQL